jgi:hypothetical protein
LAYSLIIAKLDLITKGSLSRSAYISSYKAKIYSSIYSSRVTVELSSFYRSLMLLRRLVRERSTSCLTFLIAL